MTELLVNGPVPRRMASRHVHQRQFFLFLTHRRELFREGLMKKPRLVAGVIARTD
jgi:hypothetical protein